MRTSLLSRTAIPRRPPRSQSFCSTPGCTRCGASASTTGCGSVAGNSLPGPCRNSRSLNHLSGPGCPIMGERPDPAGGGPGGGAHRQAAPPPIWRNSPTRTKRLRPVTTPWASTMARRCNWPWPRGRASASSHFRRPDHRTILFDVGRDGTGVNNASIEITGDRSIAGSVSTSHFCVVTEDKYTVYFAAEFSRPFASFGTWSGASVNKGQRSVTGPSRAVLWLSTRPRTRS